MRISGNILDRLLNIYFPLIIFYYPLSLFIRDFKHTTNLERIFFFSAMLCLIAIIDYTHVIYRKLQSLEIDDSVFIGRRKISNSDIVSIRYRSFSRSFDIITFEVLQNGIIEEFSVMDKPKLLGIFGAKGSLTLHRLYYHFPDLKDKQIWKLPLRCSLLLCWLNCKSSYFVVQSAAVQGRLSFFINSAYLQ